jgi:hypothetical protein
MRTSESSTITFPLLARTPVAVEVNLLRVILIGWPPASTLTPM